MPLSPRVEAAMSSQLSENGYAVIEEAIDPEMLERLRDRLDAQAAGEAARGETFNEIGQNRRIFNLINKGAVFRDLALHPLALAAARHVVGNDFLLSSLTAHIVQSPGLAQYVHRDQIADFRVPVVVQLLWTLDDFMPENGATRVIKGSDKWGPDLAPWSQEQLERLVEPIAAPAGSAIIFGGLTVHCAGANNTDRPRRGILAYYAKPYYRQSENYALSLSPAVYERASEELLSLLGFRSHATFGMVDGPSDNKGHFLRGSALTPRPTTWSGPLDAKGRAVEA
ncbi:MAG TPA: phytanoyl-CoA dioxygenase family protein [Alphaproteobacteria bacterium]|nr:phytanoyl-CoA dioxygenase family protein [Alphaproteobacteria bacterium]